MAKFCASCGAEVSDGYAFCEKCGAPVEGTPAAQQPVYNAAAPAKPSNGMAIGGFVCSLLGFLGFICCGSILCIPGLILSIIGLNKSKQLGGAGKGLAIAGIILGALGLVSGLISFILSIVAAAAENAINTSYYYY
jgi:hypothetical protein